MVDFTILWTNYHRQNLHIRHQIPSCGVAWNGHFCLAGAGFLFNLPLRTWIKMSRNETIKFRGQIIQNRGTRSGDHGGGQEHRAIEICWSSAGYQFVIFFYRHRGWKAGVLMGFLWCPHSKSTVIHAENRCFNKTQNISKSSFKKWLWFKTLPPGWYPKS